MENEEIKYFKKMLKVLHSQDILYCNATDKQVADAFAVARTMKPVKRSKSST